MGLICAVVPAGGAISKVHKATGWVHGTSTHQGPGREGLVAGDGEGSLGLGFGGPIRLRGLRPRPWLCLFGLFV